MITASSSIMAKGIGYLTLTVLVCCTNISCQEDEVESNLPTENLVLHLPFNGNADDLSGNGNHGIVHGAVLDAGRKGEANGSYRFDGDTIVIPHSESLNYVSGVDQGFTISFWLKQNENYTG
jgi:hypothetical protein